MEELRLFFEAHLGWLVTPQGGQEREELVRKGLEFPRFFEKGRRWFSDALCDAVEGTLKQPPGHLPPFVDVT
uniref:Uncharacterized protein n=1 Tax=Chromera velia CCMP2878 TaxID=1169474 RepID=A0A0G4HE55_9ALVE|eukprot:Cvel_6450.t1-p1 / transcript=Cvel_6450.t1 / gene=Cvel_6450 / organism=Chromera_velia_CCMP2878 / gene_product=hypothetical protein / transcript_product=hypothetical protein / location=Cvel_scaffold316:674-981(-) / protein_length=71 / sequence_SO=supercontig / SO=protein_coding / is_pseudo=false